MNGFNHTASIVLSNYTTKPLAQLSTRSPVMERVLSFDLKKKTLEFTSLMFSVKADEREKAIAIQINEGEELVCNENQVFYTTELSEVRAKDLKVGQQLFGYKSYEGVTYTVRHIEKLNETIAPIRVIPIRYPRVFLKNGVMVKTM